MTATVGLGWPVLDNDSKFLLEWTVPGADRKIRLRNGSAGFILVHTALWFHERIEPLDQGIFDEWGHNKRPLTGGGGWSKHAGGIAEDLNSTLHPYNVPAVLTFTPEQISRIHRRLRWLDSLARPGVNVLDWGGDWPSHPGSSAKPDGMHFELACSLREAEFVARRLMKTKRGRRVLAANPGQGAVILS